MMIRICLITLAALLSAVAGAQAGSLVTTQQSVAYELPDGWVVHLWTEKTGEAVLKNTKSGDLISVERYGVTGEAPVYANVEKIGDDRTLSWDYGDSPLTPADVTLKAQLTFADAKVAARISIYASTLTFKGIDKDAALTAIRAIAKSLKITGPRACWPPGECPPGTVKDVK